MADFVWPEDAGTGAAQGDDNDAANFATAYHAVGLKNYVVQGLGFTLNAGTPSLDIGSGKAVVDDSSATATQSSETRNEGVCYVAEMDARTGIGLTDSAVNHVFLEVDLSSDDTINIVVNTSNSAPSEPQVKLGTVDTSNDTTTELNRDIPVDLGNLSSKTLSELSNANISSASAGETILYDASNSEFVNSSISAGNGLGSSSSDGSFTLDVVTDGIGTNELDESAGFDFSSAISFSGGIDGGGSAIGVNESLLLDMGDGKFSVDFNGGGGSVLGGAKSDTQALRFAIDSLPPSGKTTGYFFGFDTSHSDLNAFEIFDFEKDNTVFLAKGDGDVEVPSGNLGLKDSELRLRGLNDSAWKIYFDNSASGTNNIDGQALKFNFFDGGDDGVIFEDDQDVNILELEGSASSGDVIIPNGNLDMNDKLIKDISNNTTGDSMTADPETASEDGYIEVEIDGITRQIPFYDS